MWTLIGHQSTVRLLQNSLERGRLAHSYLLIGPPHIGKMTLGFQLAQAVNCSDPNRPCQTCNQCIRIASKRHADVQIIPNLEETDGTKEIGIDQIRQLQQSSILKPFEGSCRVFIIDGAERLSQEAGNALLKILEEPPPQVVLILLARDEERLLATLRSRCQIISLHRMTTEELIQALMNRGADPQQAEELATRAQGCPGIALRGLQNPSWLASENAEIESLLHILESSAHTRLTLAANLSSLYSSEPERIRARLQLWLGWWRDLLLTKEGAVAYLVHPRFLQNFLPIAQQFDTATINSTLRLIQETIEFLGENANPRLVLEHLVIGFPNFLVSSDRSKLI